MQYLNCPQCEKPFDSDEYEYCPHCSYGYSDDEYEPEYWDDDDYAICPQCGGNIIVKVNSDGTLIENICEDCSYYSVDVE